VLQYALHVRILSPQSMADEIRKNLETALSQYAE
jgi:predicted DNA-binding transcriptional regulator YafY